MTVYHITITDTRTDRVLLDEQFEAESDAPDYVIGTAWLLSGAPLDETSKHFKVTFKEVVPGQGETNA